MDGLMMDFPLTLTHLIERAGRQFPKSQVTWRGDDKAVHRQSFAQTVARTSKLAQALQRLGVKPSDRVATLCWNHRAHLEAYLAVSGMGAVLHTLNLRLHPDELAYIAHHAEDQVVIVDRSLLPLLAKLKGRVPSLRHVIVVSDSPVDPAEGLDYEALLANEDGRFEWPALEERSAAMLCYTSGTTGNPKGVLYSHRSIVLHTFSVMAVDGLGVGTQDTVLPVVPMFHAMAWGLVHAAVAAGADLVLPGAQLDPESLLTLMADEKVTFAGGVPTIWLGILTLLDQAPRRFDLSRLKEMVIGGAAAPPALIDGFKKRHGLTVLHAWGMTETNPLGTVSRLKKPELELDAAGQLKVRATQGYAACFVGTRHVDDQGKVLPWDGETMGELEVRGPWVARAYFGDTGQDRFSKDGWFKTGDVVTINEAGYVSITDRAKDVIKSGGEWISSVALENALMSHPAVQEAAVFAGRHPKWDERPLAAVVLKKDQKATDAELRAHLEPHFAKMALPDAFVFVEQIPRTSTGKFLKSALRERYGAMLLPKAGA
jgi:fatty-acyl-CoA synthase